MCNLYTMTATVDEMRRLFGAFEGDRANLPPFDEIYPGQAGAGASARRRRRPEAGDDDLGLSRAGGGEGAAGDQRPQPRQPVLALGARQSSGAASSR